MKEFMFLIRGEGECESQLAPEDFQVHFQRVVDYINDLKSRGRLISAQPLTMNGTMLYSSNGVIKDGPFIETKEVIAGYFLYYAESFEEAKEIALAHPMLVDVPNSRIELREIKYEEGIN